MAQVTNDPEQVGEGQEGGKEGGKEGELAADY